MNIAIEDIIRLCKASRIKWTDHIAERMYKRGISRNDIINCLMNGEIIEQYPDYWLGPSCLVFGNAMSGLVIHVVVGVDDYVHVVTAYYPDESKFESDLKTRKGRV